MNRDFNIRIIIIVILMLTVATFQALWYTIYINEKQLSLAALGEAYYLIGSGMQGLIALSLKKSPQNDSVLEKMYFCLMDFPRLTCLWAGMSLLGVTLFVFILPPQTVLTGLSKTAVLLLLMPSHFFLVFYLMTRLPPKQQAEAD